MAVKKAGSPAVATATAAQPPAEGSEAADIKAASEFEASGAPKQEPQNLDTKHPAVDDNPRAGTSVEQNQIDFNDPGLSGSEAVAKNLAEQAKD